MTTDLIYQRIVDALVGELRECRKQFQFYADNHLAKNPPQLEKAAANQQMVASINSRLLHAAELFVEIDKANQSAKGVG